jgi:hypothetical protein
MHPSDAYVNEGFDIVQREESRKPRGGGFYGAYFRDPDGNKLNAFVIR